MNLLRLIRIENLAIIAACQWIIKRNLIAGFELLQNLDTFLMWLLVLATVCIAAAGNIINDIQDVAIDTINKPQKRIVGKAISESRAYTFYFVLNILGVGLGFVLCNMLGKANLAIVFVIMSALLYLYSTFLKSKLLLSNLTIVLLVMSSLLIVPFFDFIPLTAQALSEGQKSAFIIVWHYSLFAGLLTLIREIVKDIIDIDGDHAGQIYSLPIAIGRTRSAQIVFALGVFTLTLVLFYAYSLFLEQLVFLSYLFLAVAAPLLLFCIKSFGAEKPKEFKRLSLLLKIIMVLGIGSIFLLPT